MANIKTKPVEGEELEEREERKNNKSILSQVRPHFFFFSHKNIYKKDSNKATDTVQITVQIHKYF